MRIRYHLKRTSKKLIKWVSLGLLIVGLVVALGLSKEVRKLLTRATGRKANIRVDASKELGKMPRPWTSLAQGGEEAGQRLDQVRSQVTALSPSYIRLDHIYDGYGVVRKEGGNLIYSWEKLDQVVDDILATGAKPFLALSYMPPGFGGGITEPPDNWGDWQELVRATIEHYSGKQGKNIANVYYEVWNEPDLFGSFKTSGERNYLEMYRRAARGAEQVTGAQTFKLGGPANTGLYKNWVVALLEMATEENLRLDFISWHRYSWDSKDFRRDVDDLNSWLKKYPEQAFKEKVVSEWGFDSKNHPGYDTEFGVAHGMAAIREMLGGVNKAFMFEIKDGKDPEGKAHWGRWGLITHESSGLQLKPRYYLLEWLNDLGDTRIRLSGEGTWVKGMAAKKGASLQIYLVNYDQYGSNREAVPVVIEGLAPGSYQIVQEWFNGRKQSSEVTISGGTWTGEMVMGVNEVARLSLLPL